MARPTLYVTRLKANATEDYKPYAGKNPAYINAMLNPSIKPYNLRADLWRNSQKSIQRHATYM